MATTNLDAPWIWGAMDPAISGPVTLWWADWGDGGSPILRYCLQVYFRNTGETWQTDAWPWETWPYELDTQDSGRDLDFWMRAWNYHSLSAWTISAGDGFTGNWRGAAWQGDDGWCSTE